MFLQQNLTREPDSSSIKKNNEYKRDSLITLQAPKGPKT